MEHAQKKLSVSHWYNTQQTLAPFRHFPRTNSFLIRFEKTHHPYCMCRLRRTAICLTSHFSLQKLLREAIVSCQKKLVREWSRTNAGSARSCRSNCLRLCRYLVFVTLRQFWQLYHKLLDYERDCLTYSPPKHEGQLARSINIASSNKYKSHFRIRSQSPDHLKPVPRHALILFLRRQKKKSKTLAPPPILMSRSPPPFPPPRSSASS